MSLSIELPKGFSRSQEIVLGIYLSGNRHLTKAEWQTLFQTIDLLSRARISVNHQQYTFRKVYDTYIDLHLADLYIEQLLNLNDVIADSPALTATFARQIQPILQQLGFINPQIPASRFLLIYCIYWWQNFARGYAFEAEIFQDLAQTNIKFQAHNMLDRNERLTPADFIVLDLLGDIKTSTYFLQLKASRLINDFYITRVLEAGYPQTLVVFQRPKAWHRIDGEPITSSLDKIIALFPKPVRLQQRGQELIVVDYEFWKDRVRQIQKGISNES